MRGVRSALKRSQNRLLPVSTPKELQRVELLNYTKANGQELVGLAVELAEDPSGSSSRGDYGFKCRYRDNSGSPATRRLLRLITALAEGNASTPSSASSAKPQ